MVEYFFVINNKTETSKPLILLCSILFQEKLIYFYSFINNYHREIHKNLVAQTNQDSVFISRGTIEQCFT